MKNIFTKVLDFLSGLFAKKNLLIFILITTVVVLILLNLKSCGDLKFQKAQRILRKLLKVFWRRF